MATEIGTHEGTGPVREAGHGVVGTRIKEDMAQTGRYLRKHGPAILCLFLIFVLSLFLRSYFYYEVVADNPELLSGNDPYYHRRAVRTAIIDHRHLTDDYMLNYPVGSYNANPPLFEWSVALSSMVAGALGPGGALDNMDRAMQFAPAIWGALAVFPIYFIAKEIFGRRNDSKVGIRIGLIAALLLGTMASNIERSPLGFSDHDAMVVFLQATAYFFYIKALDSLKDVAYVRKWSKMGDIKSGMAQFFSENQKALGYGLLAGFMTAAVTLTWKGFSYIQAILLIYYTAQLLISQFRREDSMGVFFVSLPAFALPVILGWFPYDSIYLLRSQYGLEPGFYILIIMIVESMLLIPTRDLPWILVLPSVIFGGMALFFLAATALPALSAILFAAGGYLIRNKVYETIAEAQPSDLSRIVYSYGVATFFLALIGVAMAIGQYTKRITSKSYLFLVAWSFASIMMALSAVRFMFNATPIFAILSAWVIYLFIEWLRFETTIKDIRRYWTHKGKFTMWALACITLLGGMLVFWSDWLILPAIIVSFFLYIFLLFLVAKVMKKDDIWSGFKSFLSKGAWSRQTMGALAIIFFIVSPNVLYAIDASIPYESKGDYDHYLYDSPLNLMRCYEITDTNDDGVVSSVDITEEEREQLDDAFFGCTYIEGSSMWYLGAFGHSFPSDYWVTFMDWFATQDNEYEPEDRPAFVSWWDYGHWAIEMGDHPTVADNFQDGHQVAGNIIASQSELQTLAYFNSRLLEGEWSQRGRDYTDPLSNETEMLLFNYTGETTQKAVIKALSEPAKMIDEIKEDPDKYEIIEENPGNPYRVQRDDIISWQNAKYITIARELTDAMTLDEMVNLNADLQERTGFSIRYFAVDSRLMPFNAQNTGIFYAPLKLSDHLIEQGLPSDFIDREYVKTDPNDPNNVLRYTDEDLALFTEPEQFEGLEPVLAHQDAFYNSMFYRTFIGVGGPHLGLDNSAGFPALSGDLRNVIPMQGWMLKHFKVVYRTAYLNPHPREEVQFYQDDWQVVPFDEAVQYRNNEDYTLDLYASGLQSGTQMVRFYEGAIINGRLVTDEGNPIPDVRVTIYDDTNLGLDVDPATGLQQFYAGKLAPGVPHDTVITDADGRFTMYGLEGNNTIIASTGGGLDDGTNFYNTLLQRENTDIARLTLSISRAQAERVSVDTDADGTLDYIVDATMTIDGGSFTGSIYQDDDNDGTKDSGEDTLPNATIVLRNETNDIDYVPNSLVDGEFTFSGLPPMTYTPVVTLAGHPVEMDEITIGASSIWTISSVTSDLGLTPYSISGTIDVSGGADLKQGVTITKRDLETGHVDTRGIDPEGGYLFSDVLKGQYELSVDHSNYQPVSFSVTLDTDKEVEQDLTLQPATPFTGTAYIDADGDGVVDPGEEVSHATITVRKAQGMGTPTLPVTYEDQFDVDTEADGTFEIRLSTGHFLLTGRTVGNDGTWALHESIQNPTLTESTSLDLEFTPGQRVSGVLDLSGSPDWTLLNIQDAQAEDAVPMEVPVNDRGEFFAILPNGTYNIYSLALIENIRYVSSDIWTIGGGTRSSGYTDIELGFTPAIEVTGLVIYDMNGDGQVNQGERLGDIDLVATSGTDTITFRSSPVTWYGSSESGGGYLLFLPANEIYHITTTSDAFEDLDVLVSTHVTPGAPLEQNLTLEPRKTTVNLTVSYSPDGSGDALIGADARLSFSSNESYGFIPADINAISRDGELSIELKPGSYRVFFGETLFKNGIEETHRIMDGTEDGILGTRPFMDLEVPITDDIVDRDFHVSKDVRVKGFVTRDDTVTEVPLAALTFSHLETGKMSSVDTDENGAFSINLASGKYYIHASGGTGSDLLASLSMIDTETMLPEINLVMERGYEVTLTPFIDTDQDGNKDSGEQTTTTTIHVVDTSLPTGVTPPVGWGRTIAMGDTVELDITGHQVDGTVFMSTLQGVYTATSAGIFDRTSDFTDEADWEPMTLTLEDHLEGSLERVITEALIGSSPGDMVETIILPTDDYKVDGYSGTMYFTIHVRRIVEDRVFSVDGGTSTSVSGTKVILPDGLYRIVADQPYLTNGARISANHTAIVHSARSISIPMTVTVDVSGVVSYDDRFKGNTDVLFTHTIRPTSETTTDRWGTYLIDVPQGSYTMRALKTGFNITFTGNTLSLSSSRIIRHIYLEARDITVAGTVYSDVNTNGQYDLGEGRPNAVVRYEGKGITRSFTTDSAGDYSVQMPPGDYDILVVYNDRASIQEASFNVETGRTTFTEDLPLSLGVNVQGDLTYTDTDGIAHGSFDPSETIRFTERISSIVIETTAQNGHYEVILPVGYYSVYGRHVTTEYSRTMTYVASDEVEFLTTSDHAIESDLEYRKQKDHSVSIEYLGEGEETLILNGTAYTTLAFKVKNIGNEYNSIKVGVDTPNDYDIDPVSVEFELSLDEERTEVFSIKSTPGQTVPINYFSLSFKAESLDSSGLESDTDTVRVTHLEVTDYDIEMDSEEIVATLPGETATFTWTATNDGNHVLGTLSTTTKEIYLQNFTIDGVEVDPFNLTQTTGMEISVHQDGVKKTTQKNTRVVLGGVGIDDTSSISLVIDVLGSVTPGTTHDITFKLDTGKGIHTYSVMLEVEEGEVSVDKNQIIRSGTRLDDDGGGDDRLPGFEFGALIVGLAVASMVSRGRSRGPGRDEEVIS